MIHVAHLHRSTGWSCTHPSDNGDLSSASQLGRYYYKPRATKVPSLSLQFAISLSLILERVMLAT